MPIQTLSDVLAQRGAEQNQSQLSQIQQASGLAGLMDALRKRKQEEAQIAQGQEFAGQFSGNDQGSQALKFLASQPGGAQIVAKLLAEQKFKQESRTQALSEIDRAGQQPQGPQPLQAVAPIQGQPLGNKIDPQAELAGITDPAQRQALEQVIAAEKQGVQASASVAPKPSNKIFGWDENQAAIAAGSDDPGIAAKGKLIANEFNKRNAQQATFADRKAGREDAQANRRSDIEFQQTFAKSQADAATVERRALQDERLAASAAARAEKLANSGKEISRVDALSIDRSQKASEQANPALQLLDQADALYSKYESSRAEPILGGLARVGAAVGFADKGRAADYEVASKIAKDLGVIKLGLIGGSDTERELQVAIDTSPSPDKTVDANKRIIADQRKAINILQSEPDFKTEWIVKNGSLTKLDKDSNETYGKSWRRFQKDTFKVADTAAKQSAAQDKQPGALAPTQVRLPDGTIKTFKSGAAAQGFKKEAGL